MKIITTLGPTDEPVSLAEAKAHVVQDQTVDDSLITAQIATARTFVEDYTWRRLLQQTVIVSLDNWYGHYAIELPIAPLLKVTQITYIDTSGTTQILDPSIYQVDDRAHIPLVMPQYGKIWPPVQLLTSNAIQITCIVGYAAPFTISFATSNTILNATGHAWAAGDTVQLYNSGGTLPTGLNASKNYYVVNPTADSLELSLTSGGAAVQFTADGTGSNFIGIVPQPLRQAMLLHMGLMYNNREASFIDMRAAEIEIPFGLRAMLDAYSLKVL